MSAQARGGYEYFVLFIDDYSRYGYVYLMQRKSETFGKFKEFLIQEREAYREEVPPDTGDSTPRGHDRDKDQDGAQPCGSFHKDAAFKDV